MDTPKLKRFPKKKTDGGRIIIDRERLKEEYMNSSEYDFKTFCSVAGYHYTSDMINDFPIRSWREEKIRAQIEVQDTSIIKDGMELRGVILANRIKSIKKWDSMARMARQIMEYKMILLTEAMQTDVERSRLAKAMGTEPPAPTFKLSEASSAMLMSSLKTLRDLEQSSLLVPTQTDQKSALGIPVIKETEKEAEYEQERIDNMKWTVMNSEGLKNNELQNMMTQWFDQFSIPPETQQIEEAIIVPTKQEEPKPEPKPVLEIPPLEE